MSLPDRITIRGIGPLSRQSARDIAALVDYHDKPHGDEHRHQIAEHLRTVLGRKTTADALNQARKVRRILASLERQR